MIDITGVNLVDFVQEVYSLSRPQGWGELHFVPGPLPADEAKQLIETWNTHKHIAVSLDYVKGRACKMTVHRDGDRLKIPDRWFDHSGEDLRLLLSRCGLFKKSDEVEA
jgi:hypothetical protein